MRQLLCVILLLIISTVSASSIKEDLDNIYPLLRSNPDSAFTLSLVVLEESQKSHDYFGMSKANYILGYLAKRNGDYGKSVIYYLEAIRYADEASYEEVVKDRINLRRNLANIFRQFEANRLATIYYLEAIDLGTKHGFRDDLIKIKYFQALVYQNNEQHLEAIQFMKEILPNIEDDYFKSEVINQLGLVYLESEQYAEAEKCFTQLLEIPHEQRLLTAKALHNLGEIYYETGSRIQSIENLRQSIEIMNSFDEVNNYSLLLSYRNIGRYLFEENHIDEALEFLLKAEEIAEYGEWDPSSYEIYKTLSTLYYSIGNENLGEQYSNTYFAKVQEYLENQDEIQRREKEVNFDLITKRYQDEVKKQEKIASILFYSKTISGSLLALLLLTIGYNRYQKIRLRRSILEDLINLKVVD